MKLQRINYAEAVIETFFDGGDSDSTTRRVSALNHYTVTASDPAQAWVRQSWCSAEVAMGAGAPVWMEMARDCDLSIEGFDRVRIFSAVPVAVKESVRALVDGQWQTLIENLPGTDKPEEKDYPISGKHLQKLVIRLEHDGTQDRGATYEWIGLTDTAREAAMLALKSEFPADWPDRLLPEGDFEPHIGIFFGKEELPAIRARVKEEPLKPFYDNLRQEAEGYLSWEPEKTIGECIPNPDIRWTRSRFVENKCMSTAMQVLAFVGLIEKNADMMRMAVRMALSVAHCDKWTESNVMGSLAGTMWHHRSFTEEIHCRSCALVLDWAGGWLTDHAQEIILDAIIMKGLPRLESDFKRMEYIRMMNQGIVFSSGRVFALLACAHYYPRYKAQVLEAERDINEMIANYIQPDGGTPEGPGYWNYTFSNAMPTLYVLSRFHGGAFSDIMTPELEKTGNQGLMMLSVVGDGAQSIPVNDAHGGYYSPLLMAAFYKLTGKEDFARLMALSLDSIRRTGHGKVELDLFIMAPDQVPAAEKYEQEGFSVLPDLGQARIIRKDAEQGRVSLSFFTGLADFGHYHLDKGSFVLETAQEVLLMDRGTLPYSHPDSRMAQMPEYHNLLFPELSGDKARQKHTREGAYLVYARNENGVFDAMGDTTRCWTGERIEKCTRRIVSGNAKEYLIEDELMLSEEAPASFLLNTAFPCEAEGNAVLIHAPHATVCVEPVNWTPCEIECVIFGVDEHLQPVWRICLRNQATKAHSLKTRITIL